MSGSINKLIRTRSNRLILMLAFVMLSGTPAIADENKLPEVDKDGLHLLKDTKVAVAYARPGASLAPYSKLMILDCYVDFEKDWQRNYNLNEVGLQGRVTDKDAETIKERLAEEFHKVFTDVLTRAGHEIVTEAGPDVLLLRPALINVDVVAPDVMRAGRVNTWIRSAGEMTLYMEMYDSATSTLLVRVIDPRADDSAFAKRANRAVNKQEADRILRDWAKLLTDHLGEVKDAAK